MAFSLNTEPFLLKEGKIEIGTWTNPDQIGNGTIGDPTGQFSGNDLGWFQQGSTNIALNRTYAEARGGTPSIILRKDLTQKDFMINLALFQYDIDTLELAKGLYVQKAYSASGFTGDLAWIGSDEPTQPYYGYLITSALTDGTPFYIGMWYGKVTTEDISDTLSGTDYSVINAQLQAFPHPNFGSTASDAQKHYGIYWIDNS